MAVFTPVSLEDLTPWMAQFPLGKAIAIKGIADGIENSNFFVTTETGEYVLTVFEKLNFEQLSFYVNLMRHLADRGVLVSAPIASIHGEILHSLHGKPALIATKLVGTYKLAPAPMHCAAVGAMLAKMHIAGKDFPMHQPNLRGFDWWNETVPTVLSYLAQNNQDLLREEMRYQQAFVTSEPYRELPRGPIHADLFRNNVMFDGDQLTGFFDFYFAGYDTWLFDVAVTVNDWCINLETGALDVPRVRAMLDAYRVVRPFAVAEQAAWQPMLRAAALRFWISRLYDFYLPRDAQMLTPHDPTHFERILRQRIAHLPPALS